MKAVVVHRGQERKAKGFSCAEIEGAGIDCDDVCSLNIPFDMRRSTSYKVNVDALKAFGKNIVKKEVPKIAAVKAK